MQGKQIAVLIGAIVVIYLILCGLWTVADAGKTLGTGKTHEPQHGQAQKEEPGATAETERPLPWARDEAIWAIAVFLGLLVVLRVMAWRPWREGTLKREETIRLAVEEAKIAREETARARAVFEARMREAEAEIPKMLDEARRDADRLHEELKKKALGQIDDERRRLRREITTAKDQALQEILNQTAELATVISAKAIGQSLSDDDYNRLTEEALNDVKESGDEWKSKVEL